MRAKLVKESIYDYIEKYGMSKVNLQSDREKLKTVRNAITRLQQAIYNEMIYQNS